MEFFGVRGYGYTSMRLMLEGPLSDIELPRDPLTESNLKIRKNGDTDLAVTDYSVDGKILTLDEAIESNEYIEIYYLDYESPISVEVINLINELSAKFNSFENSAQDILANSEAARLSAEQAEEAAIRAESASGSIGNVMRPENNLNELLDINEARFNLGLGLLATQNSVDQSMKIDKAVELGVLNINTLGAPESVNIYFQTSNANATANRGYPVSLAGTLYVTRSAYGCQQMYVTHAQGKIYVRGLLSTWNGVNGPWQPWEQVGAPVITEPEITAGTSVESRSITAKIISDYVTERLKTPNNTMTVTGAIRATGDITSYYSDIRLKKNIKNIDDALSIINSINGVRYNANEVAEKFGYDSSIDEIGLLAQEVQQHVPEAIAPAPFDIDEQGGSLSGENYITIKYERLIPVLVEAVKQLSNELNDMRKELNGKK